MKSGSDESNEWEKGFLVKYFLEKKKLTKMSRKNSPASSRITINPPLLEKNLRPTFVSIEKNGFNA